MTILISTAKRARDGSSGSQTRTATLPVYRCDIDATRLDRLLNGTSPQPVFLRGKLPTPDARHGTV